MTHGGFSYMVSSKKDIKKNILTDIRKYERSKDTTSWEGTIEDYIPMVLKNKKLGQLAHARVLDMIESAGVEFDEADVNKTNPKYKFFQQDLFGVDEPIRKVVKYLKAAASGSQVGRRILLLYGPTSSGKSQMATLLKSGIEEYTRTEGGALYAIADCPIHENPLNMVPNPLRKTFSSEYGIKIDPLARPCPVCQLNLDEKYGGEWLNMPVKRIFLSEANRKGIGTFLPGDNKCVVGDSLVLTENGLIPIEEMCSNEEEGTIETNVYSMDHSLNNSNKSFRYYNKDVATISTNFGSSISGTLNHPLLTVNSIGDFVWREIKDINIGDSVVMSIGSGIDFVKKDMPENPLGIINISDNMAKFIGLYISEGSIDKNNRYVEITNQNNNIQKIVFDAMEEIGIDKNLHVYNGIRNMICNKNLVDTLKIWGFSTGAHSKRIPHCVMTSGKLNEVILGMWLGGGNCGKHKTKDTNEAIYSTVSSELANQVHSLLFAMGVPSKKIFDRKIGTSGAYKILVSGSRVNDLVYKLNLPTWKMTRPLIDCKNNDNLYLMPQVDKLVSYFVKNSQSLSKWYRYGKSSTKTYGRRFSQKSYLDFVEDVKNTDDKYSSKMIQRLDSLCDSKFVYATVTDKKSSIEHVYDIQVPGVHNFIANGFVSHNSQSITELVGSVDFSKLADYGVESDPRAYKFDGELNVANRGMMEMIEMLKVDPKFLYVLLTLAQEKTIKTERFPLIYADEFIIAHSVVGDTPVPFRKHYQIGFDTIANLTDKNDTDIEVLAVNMGTKKPEWTSVKSFHKHPFTGNLIKTIQNNGVIETTWNHSIYSTDHEWFYPEDMKDVLVVRDGFKTGSSIGGFKLELDDDLIQVEDKAYHKLIEGYKGNGAYKKNFVKSYYEYPKDEQDIKDLLTVFAWYITEGHVNDDHCIISQNNTAPLKIVKRAAENISSSTASLQDRSDKEDQTSRLHLSTKVWKKIIEKNCGKYSDGKKIPNFVFCLEDHYKWHFLNEIIKGDGTRVPSNKSCAGEKYLQECFRYKTTSKMLAAQVCFLAAQLGIDFGISHAYTTTGKEAFEIRYRQYENKGNCKNQIEKVHVEDLDVYDIECVGNHSFVAGVGNILCHNTNETEYRRFLADQKLEALHDRIIVHKFPYNLILDEEVKIYEKLVGEADFGDLHIAPLTLKIASMFAILTRLEPGKDQNLTLLKKMQLYNSEDVDGFTREDIKNIKADTEREGMDGVSPRYIFNCIADCFTKYDMSSITPIDVMRSIKENFESNAKLTKEDIDKFDDILTVVVEEYSKMAKNEVQKAFFVNFDKEIENLLNNYIDNVGAYLGDTKVVDEFGDQHEPNKYLMRGIEEKVGISDASKDSFRQEVYRKVLKAKTEGGFDYKSHAKLREALEKQLFDERSDTIRLTVSSRNPDPEALQKLNQVIDTLVKQYGYTADSANQLLRYVNSLMSRTT